MLHIMQVLFDQRVVHPVEGLAEVYKGSQDSMELHEVQCGRNKVEQLNQIVSA